LLDNDDSGEAPTIEQHGRLSSRPLRSLPDKAYRIQNVDADSWEGEISYKLVPRRRTSQNATANLISTCSHRYSDRYSYGPRQHLRQDTGPDAMPQTKSTF
jgi:hypothetical protein